MVHSDISIDTALAEMAAAPKNAYRSNAYKLKREAWCVAKMLQHLNLNNYLIRPSLEQSDTTDVSVIDPQNRTRPYCIQVTEIAPRDLQVKTLLSDAIHNGYNSLEDEVFTLASEAINKKEAKYSSQVDKQNLNLLIYLNPPSGVPDDTGWKPTVMFSMDIDFDRERFSQLPSNFGTIMLFTGEELEFVKGNRLI